MHSPIFKVWRGGEEKKARGYWIANQVFIVSGSCVFLWFSVWCDNKGFVYTAKKNGAVTPMEELNGLHTVTLR